MKKNYLGLSSSFHDSSVAIINSNGEIVFAEATERYMQHKRAINICPDIFFRITDLMKTYCDRDADLVVAHTWSNETEGQMKKEIDLIEENCKIFKGSYDGVPFFLNRQLAFYKYVGESQLHAVRLTSKTLDYSLGQIEKWHRANVTTKRYDHHLTHAATACYTSPFSEGVCAILDGYGEGRASCCYTYKNGKIQEIGGIKKENVGSLGLFYIFVCDTCGFGHLAGEEWKVMGLAAYGELDGKIYDIFRSLIKVNGLNIEFCRGAKSFQLFQKMYSIRRKKEEPPVTAANIAYTGQLVFSEILFEYLNNLYDLGISENLILGGGCALNSSTNGKIIEKTKFKKVHIFCAPGDDGNAVGSALLAFHEDNPGEKTDRVFQHPYLGSVIPDSALENLKKFGRIHGMKVYSDAVHKKAAELLSSGKIIGWVQGRAEFGPRALGNRSILADPRSPEIKNEINERIKFREQFRPFAPSILHEFGNDYFENYQESPYMERTLHFKKEVMKKVPGVVHDDGTGRLQTVKEEWNEAYYRLIKAFYEITGIPLILNTSFNVMGKPIMHSLEDAIAVFYTCGLDALVIGDILIEKPAK